MGLYINPPKESKEDFLRKFGTIISLSEGWTDRPRFSVPVILINNIAFTAAGIGFDEDEFNEFTQITDRATIKMWVPISEIVRIHPEMKGALGKLTVDEDTIELPFK